jgi:osmotically-inducible protein OsmY
MATRWEDRDRGDYRDEQRYHDRDRGLVSRTRDEVASWFGDDEAARRRRMDDMRDDRHDRDRTDRFAGSTERGWDRARDAVRDATDRDRDGRRGMAEWNDNDRPWQGGAHDSRRYYSGTETWRDSRSSGYRDPDYRNTERNFGDTSRYSAADPYVAPAWNKGAYDARDWQERSYSGRGPRGYQRGDERIREDICERLTEDPRIDASDVEVQVVNAEVTLAGSVRTRDEKHFTESVVERIMGVREVNNNLKVRPPDEVLGTARSGSSMLGLTETPPPQSSPKTK